MDFPQTLETATNLVYMLEKWISTQCAYIWSKSTKNTEQHGICQRISLLVKFQLLLQLTFTCSKSKTETLEKGVKYVQN